MVNSFQENIKTQLTVFLCFVWSFRLLTELESPSWWPFSSKLWKMPAETKPKGGTSTASPKALGKEGVVVRIPAVISQGTASHVKAGSLTILVSGLEIRDSSSLLMHRFEREDIDDIKVHTPYEISVRQRFIGKPDIAYRLISAKMPEAVPILEVQFSKKMELLEGGLTPGSASVSSPAEKGCSVWQAGKCVSVSRAAACGTPFTCCVTESICWFCAPVQTVRLFVNENTSDRFPQYLPPQTA
ncbi:synaptosomal-associated protein 47 [Leptonychotes weddellii]|uniref:Synaptosomal-associated protein 47 n=1 Tax=Leptonychotes weddellii TaxID=9713 RepID=A0A7F8RPT2_LEPWE|nr:synaptosomal-associated protein 47 [Leptonychotes weddellii]